MGANKNMIGTETLDRVIGQDVYDQAGEKIGSASEVYLDDETGQPEWATVRTGLFGTKESFVPIRNADLTNDGLRVAVSKEQVKDAPKIDTDGHLSLRKRRSSTGTTAWAPAWTPAWTRRRPAWPTPRARRPVTPTPTPSAPSATTPPARRPTTP